MLRMENEAEVPHLTAITWDILSRAEHGSFKLAP